MRTFAFWLILVALGFALVETVAALALFHAGQLRGNQRVTFAYADGRLAVWQLAAKTLSVLGRDADRGTTISAGTSPLFVHHPTLGYTMVPGTHAITMSGRVNGQPLQRDFSIRIRADSTRATSRPRVCASRRIHVFGDSFIWGWGLDDAQTFEWMLQTKYPGYEVLNHAHNGYGNIHALIQIGELRQEVGAEDILIVAYADYYNRRNVAAPAHIRIYNTDKWRAVHAENAMHPFGYLEDGALRIGRVGIRCATNRGHCDREDPDDATMHAVTKAILTEIAGMTDARVVVAFFNGNDDDPVVSFLTADGIPVVDMRPRPGFFEADSFAPLDAHPGPLTHHHWFRTLGRFLDEHDWIAGDRPEAAAGTCAPR